VFGFRIIVDKVDDCYRALGIVHRKWNTVPGRFKDYISTPKQNDYRSIHTTIVGPSKQRVELQIRTREMHDVAEYGVAAHAIYKDKSVAGKANGHDDADFAMSKDSNAYAWLRHTIESLSEGDNPEEFLENTKLELFQDQVFCFTPKGRLIALPRGATPVDFAYAVHTDIGNSCVGAKINGRIMPLVTRLQNGDEVEIVRSNAQTPPAAWEHVVVTGKARSAIRRASRMAVRKQYAGLGHRILERAFERAGKEFTKDVLKQGLKRLGHKEADDVLAAVGRGEIPSDDVVRAVYPDYQDARNASVPAGGVEGDGWFNLTNATGMMFRIPGNTGPEDDQGAATRDAIKRRCRSAARRATFRCVSRPKALCPATASSASRRRARGSRSTRSSRRRSPPMTTSRNAGSTFAGISRGWSGSASAQIIVTAINAPGSLAEIAKIIGEMDANIHTLSMVRTAPDFTEMIFDLEVWDLKHLNGVIARLRDAEAVSTGGACERIGRNR
jgi:guanosine-3',5'-bis(diphosphate) 3'-pyrophosphohydrolase